MRSLMWFRSDLRVRDNTALTHACRMADAGPDGGVVACFVISPGEWRAHDVAAVRVDLMLRTLAELSRSLGKLNIPLKILRAAAAADVPKAVVGCARSLRCDAIYFNREYEFNERVRDARTGELARSEGIGLHSYTDQVVLEPGTVLTEAGGAFTVFSPFKRKWIKEFQSRGEGAVLSLPGRQAAISVQPDTVPASVAGFESRIDPGLWPAGETHAEKRLGAFAARAIASYKATRDTPSVDGTSVLSPYLAIGAISPRRCIEAALNANGGKIDSGNEGCVHWISEVLWREFYVHVMAQFPRVCKHRAFKPSTERIRWRDDPAGFEAWCEGRTGVPIVDAAQRQLLATGWMHNRLRMISAMFLTKDLLIDWRLGERFFMQNLVDGFLASNNGGWQWSASTGTDAAPYFRVFNPYSQSRTCDERGTFIRKWVPELADVDGDAVHDPETLPGLLRAKINYPRPIVDHAMARVRVLEVFKAADAMKA
jgi:deoxyribodipyrimidine photo-lyase